MKILIAEDDPFFQKFYGTQLKEHGYEIAIAINGIEALEQLHIFKPDMLLLDIIMPLKDGFEVLKEKLGDASVKHIPVLVFSTLGQESDIQKAMGLGAKGYINKSFFDLDILLKKIQELVKE